MIYLSLFLVFFKIGLFNFGGGYAMISFLQNETVLNHSWLTASEFTDIVAISQMTPGPLGVNLATYAGYVVSGNILGAAIATFALCLPSFLLMLFLSSWLQKHHSSNAVQDAFSVLKPAVCGLIAAAAIMLCGNGNIQDWRGIVIFALSFIAIMFFKAKPALVMAVAGSMGLVIF